MLVVCLIILLVICIYLFMRVRMLSTKVQELKKSDVMKTTFIRALGREIRTPLHSVTGMAEIIAREDLYLSKSEKKTISDKIQYNASMISTLLDEVAIYSEGSHGHQLQDDRFSPNQLIRRCLDGNRSFVQDGARLTFRHDLGDDVFVSTDRHIVEVVLNKLVFSACRFTSDGEVAVGCHRNEATNFITFYVEDTGNGIPEERKDVLFKWFDDPTDTFDEVEFDLSVANRLAEKIGGYLHYDERYQKGTRMEFILPVR